MNLTLVSLIANGIFNRSPYFAVHDNFALISSSFTNSFSTILFSQKISHAIVDNSKFSSILATSILISSEDHDNVKFDKTFLDKGELSNVKISNCLFYQCTSTGNGGGIMIGSASSETKFSLSYTGFYNCKASKGDAFYSETGSLQFQDCWIDKCPNSVFFVKEREDITIQQIFISNSKLNSYIEKCPNFHEIQYLNLSFNRDSIHITPQSKFQLRFCDFSVNAGQNLFDITVEDELNIDYVNFVNNNHENAIIKVTGGHTIVFDCYFIDDASKLYFNAIEGFRKITMCSFNQNSDVVKAKCPNFIFLSMENKFNQTQTTLIQFHNLDRFWDKMPKTKEPLPISTSTILSIVAIVALGIGVLFLVCRLCGNRGYNNKVPLLYTA